MKKFLGLVLLLVACSFASAPSYDITLGNYEWGRDTAISTGVFDTVKNWTGDAKDSITIVTKFKPDQGYDYILVRDALTGGTDSIKINLAVLAYNPDGSFLYETSVDSFTTAAGEAVRLPFGGSLIGSSFTIKARGYSANSTVGVILNKLEIWKRRVIDYSKKW